MSSVGKTLAELMVLVKLPSTHSGMDFHVETLELVKSRLGCNVLASQIETHELTNQNFRDFLMVQAKVTIVYVELKEHFILKNY